MQFVQASRGFREPTSEEQEQFLDETRQDVDGVTMSWDETQRRYMQIPGCNLAIVWAYWADVKLLEKPKEGDEELSAEWTLCQGVSTRSELTKKDSSDSSSEPDQERRAGPDSPKISRSARSTRSSSCSQASERAASEPPAPLPEGMTDRLAKEKGTRPVSQPPPWKPAMEQPFEDVADKAPEPGGDRRR